MTNRPPLHYRTLSETAADIRDGKLSCEAVTQHALDRIASLEPRLHAFAEVRAEGAIADARAADARRARGETLGALHGIPLAVKDLCAMAGTATRAGGLFSTGFKPTDTATVVTRLQEAGAIIVGKSQLTEGAWGTHHPQIVPPVNPWAPQAWSGSSSSGSGVSVAAGLAYGAIGTDTAGSIRFPSACNGLVGLKPTWGRVSRHGVFPLSDTFDHVGPMTRSVLDAAMMFDAIAGADPLDPTTRAEPTVDCAAAVRGGTLRGVRIGIDPGYAFSGMDEVTDGALRSAIAVMEAAGAVVVEVEVPVVGPWLERAIASAFVEAAISHSRTYPSQREAYSNLYSSLLDIGRSTTALDYAAISIWRREFRGGLTRLFVDVDMMATPVIPIEPPPADAMNESGDGAALLGAAPLLAYTIPYNLAGVPSLTLPMGRGPSGAPLGFQLIGPDLSEAVLLSAGAGYEKASDFGHHHPEV